jgi:hypothetical protein
MNNSVGINDEMRVADREKLRDLRISSDIPESDGGVSTDGLRAFKQDPEHRLHPGISVEPTVWLHQSHRQ